MGPSSRSCNDLLNISGTVGWSHHVVTDKVGSGRVRSGQAGSDLVGSGLIESSGVGSAQFELGEVGLLEPAASSFG